MTPVLPYDQDFAADMTRELWGRVRNNPPTGVRPRTAATLILIDLSGDQPKVLLGRRHSGHRFMPGRFVFPGGRVEAQDGRVGVAADLDPFVEQRLMACVRRPSAARARALALAAVRETFEETGILIGTRRQQAEQNKILSEAWNAFFAQDLMPRLDAIHFVGRAVTPPRNKMRFDTYFFAADASTIAAIVPGAVGPDAELTELVWTTIPEALGLGLLEITRVMLRELENRRALGMGHHLPVPFYRTERKGWVRREL